MRYCLLIMAAVLVVGCGRQEKPDTPGETTTPPAPAPVPAGFHKVYEIETHAAIEAPMVVEDDAEAAGGKCVRVPLGAGKPPEVQGTVSLDVELPAAGKAYIWLRAWWNGECSNSVVLRIPGQPPHELGQDATYNAWHWVKLKGPPIELPAGTRTLVIEQREDGVGLDQLLLTTDEAFVPMGIEEE